MVLLGFQKVDFVPQGQSESVKFGRIFVGSDIKENGKGQKVDSFKCSVKFYDDVVSHLSVGSSIEVYFDRYQRVSKIDVIK